MGIDIRERYIDPYTDFGFKKLFGTELNKDLLISFHAESVKDYWDYYSTMKTAHKKGKAEGLAEGEAKGRAEEKMENARRMKTKGLAA